MANKPYLQTGDYIPRTDAGFMLWVVGFVRETTADPERFGLTLEEAQDIALWAGRWIDAVTLVQHPPTRTSAAVQGKRDMRRKVERIMREYAQQIKNTRGITFQDLVELGLHVDDLTKTSIGAPSSAPVLMIPRAQSLAHILRYGDQSTPNAKRKPANVVHIEIAANVGDSLNLNAEDARLVGTYGRQPIRIDWPARDIGKNVVYFGRWVTRKGLKGPWSLPVFMTIAAGGCPKEFLEKLKDGDAAALRLAA